jgi:hypothetical protein
MRKYEAGKTLFMGAGKHTEKKVKALHTSLDDIVSRLSGLQQCGIGPDPLSTDDYEDVEAEYEKKAEAFIEELSIALGVTPCRADNKVMHVKCDSPEMEGPEMEAIIYKGNIIAYSGNWDIHGYDITAALESMGYEIIDVKCNNMKDFNNKVSELSELSE